VRRLLVITSITLAGLVAGCASSSAVSSDKADVARDLQAVKIDRAALQRVEPRGRVVLCDAITGCPTTLPLSLPPASPQLTRETRRLSSDQFRLEGAEKQLATDEAASK
jgi:hypothetical protein